ncbi:hypothetical protein FOA52_010151 [Chlamydomonas sp. UWO 241]|nr:hypothetical protein FOA52_010151 [Chlamydomonas sp. UWO 241]
MRAMSRAHRIGQTETVNIYRLVTSGSVEEDILERAKRKMVLDHLVIQRMDTSGRTVLGRGGDGDGGDGGDGAAPPQALFAKEELANILRFGAEGLFKAGEEAVDGVQGTGGAATEQDTRAYEEDIDAILARAEVVDSRTYEDAGADGVASTSGAVSGGGLLQSFNVATFKSDEDDAAFWSRLIPATARPAAQEQEDLLPRQARLRLAEDAYAEDSPSRAERASSRAGAAAFSGRKLSGGEPGPPVDGALLRVDEWLLDVDEAGHAKAPPDADTDPACRSLSRRDANAFVRAVRRYGLPSRLAEICADAAGGTSKAFDDTSAGQRLSLFHTLIDSCRRAVDMAGDDPKDAILDFFGVAVKAQELAQHYAQLRYLERCASPHAGQPGGFRLLAEWCLPAPKWGKPLGWSTRDDEALLMGVYLYGLGHWDKTAGDERLRLGDKLASLAAPGAGGKGGHGGGGAKAGGGGGGEAGEEAGAGEEGHGDGGKGGAGGGGGTGGAGMVLKASHLETRALGLLRKMHAAKKAKQARVLPPPSRKGDKGAGGGGVGASGRDAGGGGGAGREKDGGAGGRPRSIAKAAAAHHQGRHQADGGGGGGGGDGKRRREDGGRGGGGGAGPSGSGNAHPASDRGRQHAGHAHAHTAAHGDKRARSDGGGGGGDGGGGDPDRQHRNGGSDRQAHGHGAGGHGAPAGGSGGGGGGGGGSGSGAIGSKEAAELLSGCTDDLRALRKLGHRAGDLSPAECAARTRELLAAIGGVIEAAGSARAAALWDAVSRAAKSPMSGERLMAVYAKIKAVRRDAAAGGAASAQQQAG